MCAQKHVQCLVERPQALWDKPRTFRWISKRKNLNMKSMFVSQHDTLHSSLMISNTFYFNNIEISGETTTGFVGHITPVCQHTHVKKEEPEEEDYLCKNTWWIKAPDWSSVTLYIHKLNIFVSGPVLQYLCSQPHPSCSSELYLRLKYLNIHGVISGDWTLNSVSKPNGGFQMKHVKEEESEDEDYPHTMG